MRLSQKQVREIINQLKPGDLDSLDPAYAPYIVKEMTALMNSELPSAMVKDQDGQWCHTVFLDFSDKNKWQSAVETADEGNPLAALDLLRIGEEALDEERRAYIRDRLDQTAGQGNPLPLLEMLCNEEEALDDESIAYIRDLLDRHQPFSAEHQQRLTRLEPWSMEYRRELAVVILLSGGLKKKQARPHTPIYARSLKDAQIDCAISELKAMERNPGYRALDEAFVEDKGADPEYAAVTEIARLHGINDPETLYTALGGRRGAANRKAARRKKYLRADVAKSPK